MITISRKFPEHFYAASVSDNESLRGVDAGFAWNKTLFENFSWLGYLGARNIRIFSASEVSSAMFLNGIIYECWDHG
jgi:hypothetical protein